MTRFQVFIIAAMTLSIGLAGGLFLSNDAGQALRDRQSPLPPAVITVPSVQPSLRTNPVDAQSLGRTFVGVSKHVRPAVVSLRTERLVKHPSGDGRGLRDFFQGPLDRFFGTPEEVPQHSMGSGFIVDGKSGYILTNHHVVDGATDIDVTLFDSKVLKAVLVGSDPKTDLAVIRIYNHEDVLPNAILGDSDALEVGEWIIAVGNPFGLNHTVTAGIVSGRGRVLNYQNYEDFIQTDAAINPGNSGGPLVNLDGEVVGISTAIASNNGYFQGAGFAIPINQARSVMAQLIQTGHVARGYIGIRMETLNADASEGLGIDHGILIQQIEPDTPADQAGLQAGDVIVEFQGKSVEESTNFRNTVASIPPGSKVAIKVWRDDTYHDITLTLGELPTSDPPQYASRPAPSREELGLSVMALSPEDAGHYGNEYDGGVVVSAVKSGSLAYRSGLQAGDLIEQVNHIPVSAVEEYNQIVDEIEPGQVMMLFIRRDATVTRVVALRKPAK